MQDIPVIIGSSLKFLLCLIKHSIFYENQQQKGLVYQEKADHITNDENCLCAEDFCF